MKNDGTPHPEERMIACYNRILKASLVPVLVCAFAYGGTAYAAKPLAAITGIESTSPRTAAASQLLETHLSNVLDGTGVFSRLNTGQLKTEMARFNCTDDPCVLRFGRNVKLGILVRGTISDRGDYAALELYCFGLETPHNGRVIYRYKTDVSLAQPGSKAADFSAVYEEHAGRFVAGLLRAYRRAALLHVSAGGAVEAAADAPVNGRFQIYRYRPGAEADDIRPYDKIAEAEFTDGRAEIGSEAAKSLRGGDFVLYSYSDRAAYLDEFYYGRKKEMVFEHPSAGGTLLTMLFSVPGSAAMPLMAPLGYYAYGDFEGLYLWAVNAAPYLYLEFSGFQNDPKHYKDHEKDISRDAAARNTFAWYMLLMGGLPLFVDAYSHQYLQTASHYGETQPLMGNGATAAYLSLVAGGAGHFYRGYRFWGYLYFHVDTILIYYGIRCFTPGERYNPSTGSYEKGTVRRKRGYAVLGALAAVKIAEITHVLLLRDNIRAGVDVQERFSFEPAVMMDVENGPLFGAQCAYRF